jgi:hypothetical protein
MLYEQSKPTSCRAHFEPDEKGRYHGSAVSVLLYRFNLSTFSV